jgi:hypothetical protein
MPDPVLPSAADSRLSGTRRVVLSARAAGTSGGSPEKEKNRLSGSPLSRFAIRSARRIGEPELRAPGITASEVFRDTLSRRRSQGPSHTVGRPHREKRRSRPSAAASSSFVAADGSAPGGRPIWARPRRCRSSQLPRARASSPSPASIPHSVAPLKPAARPPLMEGPATTGLRQLRLAL